MWCLHVFTFSGSVTVGNQGNSAETPELSAQVEVASVKIYCSAVWTAHECCIQVQSGRRPSVTNRRHFSHRSPEKAGKTWVRSTVRHRHDNILSRVCLVLTDHLFTPLPAAAVVRLPSNRFHVNAA